MITEVLLILPLYLILFPIWWRFRHLIKVMDDVENMLNDYEFFGDSVDTPKEDTEQHRKRECLKSVISKGKAYLLGSKWTQEKVDKASDCPPMPKSLNEMSDLFKNVFWYIIREICNEKILPGWCVFFSYS